MKVVLRFLFAPARLAVLGFILLSSVYALLAYIPFTYQQVHKGGLLPWLTTFGRIHAQLYWAAFAIACATLAPEFRRARTRWLTISFAVVYAVAGVLLQIFPVMARLRNDASSFVWAMIALTPLLWIAAIDLAGHIGAIEWAEYCKEDDQRIFRAAWQTAIFVSLVYCCIFYARAGTNPGGTWAAPERLSVLLSTMLCHALIFGVLFAALNLARSAASLTPWPSRTEFVLSNLLTAAVGWQIVRMLVFHPISFDGALANVYAGLLVLGLISCIAGLGVRRWKPALGPADGLSLALSAISLRAFSKRLLQPVLLIALGCLAWMLAVNTAVMDWNYMFQKLTACMIWMIGFASLHAMAPRLRNVPDHRIKFLFLAVLTMTGYRYAAAAASTHPDIGAALEKYAGYDASFRLIRDALSAPPRNETFYKFLSQNTNIPRSVPTAPVDIDPAGKLVPLPGQKPNVFIVVVDSLRRDYLGTYNDAVKFTPALNDFARESVVFRNAFTRYGGTGLAEPSIWVGGMLLHKQYVTPFYPMNALSKLVEAEKYRSFISMDSVLRVIEPPPPDLVELDAGKSGMEYRLNTSLDELEDKLDHRSDAARPIFAYTQAQDIHISVINREKSSVIDGGNYAGFFPPYASRVHRMDAAFGKFVQYLKARGLYDSSVVVLTADHGDSLGEDGRWGHAYTLVPEVVRVPLLVHLPKSMHSLYSDPGGVAFQSDITPSLYSMLGHEPTTKNGFYGRPLFTKTPAEAKASRRDSYLIAASYAAVYGVLGDYGRSLYVFDAVNYKDTFFTMSDGNAAESSRVSSSQRTDSEEFVRKAIGEISAFYKFKPR